MAAGFVPKTLLSVTLVLAVGCGAGTAAMSSPSTTDPHSAQIDDLRREQVQALYTYDMAMSQGEGACGQLCKHHTRICELANRICAIADANPDHPRGLAACQQANETCRDVTERLPQQCWCRK